MLHIGVVGADGLIPADALGSRAERLDKLPGPYFGIDSGAECTRRRKAAAKVRHQGRTVHGRHTRKRGEADGAGKRRTDCGVDAYRRKEAQEGQKDFSHSWKKV